jgi:hypothetical protein
MSKKCGLICLGLGIVAGYAACKYGDVIVESVKKNLGKKSVEDLAEEIKADSEEKDYIVLPVEENEEDKVNVLGDDFPEFLKKFREENKKLEDDKLNVPVKEVKDLSDDSSLIEEVEKEVEKPKKRTVRKPAAKKK